MNTKVKISTLWIVVMLNMAFADILSFMLPGKLEEIMTGSAGAISVTQELMLVFAILIEIPIAMIILSRVLKYRVNRWVNSIACAIAAVFVVAGGSTDLSYIFFAAVEIVCMVLIVRYAWKLTAQEG